MVRRNADCNPLELAYALLIKLPGVDPKTVEQCPSWLHCPKFQQFRANLLTQGNLQPLMDRFNTLRSPEWENCIRVIALEKTRFDHPALVGVDRKTAKGDIWLEMEDGRLMGISIKATTNATKTNFSVESMMEKDTGNRVKRIRKEFLTENGFPKHLNENRNQVNALFYDRNNPYFSAIREVISLDENIPNQLMKHLFCLDCPVKIWEFDGVSLKQLGPDSARFISFTENESLYTGGCAKMFYKLVVEEGGVLKNYRVEIRGKGNLHSSSMQFQVHESHLPNLA